VVVTGRTATGDTNPLGGAPCNTRNKDMTGDGGNPLTHLDPARKRCPRLIQRLQRPVGDGG